jgi:hypothetical protein
MTRKLVSCSAQGVRQLVEAGKTFLLAESL